MPRCRNRRRVVVQRCPAVPTAPNSTARSSQVGVGVVHDDDAVVAAQFQDACGPAAAPPLPPRAGPLRVDPVKLTSGMRRSLNQRFADGLARAR